MTTALGNLGRAAWRYFFTDGVPSSGIHEPLKSEILAFVTALESRLDDENDILTVSGTSRTLLSTDNRKKIRFLNAGDAICYVPEGLPTSFKVVIEQGPDAGQVTFMKAPDTDVVVNAPGGEIAEEGSLNTTAEPSAIAVLHMVSADVFNLSGNLDVVPE